MNVRELAASATKKEYHIEIRRVTVEDKKEPENKFAQRDYVWGTLRKCIKEREKVQVAFKRVAKGFEADAMNFGKIGMRYIFNAILDNAAELSGLYAVVRFLRTGVDQGKTKYDDTTEDFINSYFRRNQIFRRNFWELWNRKFNPDYNPGVRVTKKDKTSEPLRCPKCNRFVSKSTRRCNYCNVSC